MLSKSWKLLIHFLRECRHSPPDGWYAYGPSQDQKLYFTLLLFNTSPICPPHPMPLADILALLNLNTPHWF
jgi:hypothetical protein